MTEKTRDNEHSGSPTCYPLIVWRPQFFTHAESLIIRKASDRRDWGTIEQIRMKAMIRSLGIPRWTIDTDSCNYSSARASLLASNNG